MGNPIKEGRSYVSNRKRWVVLSGLLVGIIFILARNQFVSTPSNVPMESASNRVADGISEKSLTERGFVPFNSEEHIGVNPNCSDYEVGGVSIETYQSWTEPDGSNQEGIAVCDKFDRVMVKDCNNVTISEYGIDDYCTVG